VNWPDTKDDIFNPNIEYGTMTDPRDGKTYRTVEVLGQIWMAENLNFADSANFPLLKGNTFCYEDDEEKCNILGRLYKRQAAMYTTMLTASVTPVMNPSRESARTDGTSPAQKMYGN